QRLQRILRERISGQEMAQEALVNSILLRQAGLRFEDRPIGSYLFLGPSGVGKTEIARALADWIGSEFAMTRFNMSEYQEAHSVSRLIGPPPGYVGYQEGGAL